MGIDISRYIKPRYTFEEIIEHQKLPLEMKERFSVEIIRQAAGLSKHNMALAFSGGKDSQVVSDLIERFCPDIHSRMYCVFGNTGVEFPESLRFARKYGAEYYGGRFKETKPVLLQNDELRYEFAKKIVAQR
ncbi:MAG: phosphoadenosine phosphosulfate reductase family protein [Oscillospiraceae bacterium]|nr:phosphoadenosine phosphosulfate reductase family protein [Oscillospiraceae bacterium]